MVMSTMLDGDNARKKSLKEEERSKKVSLKKITLRQRHEGTPGESPG